MAMPAVDSRLVEWKERFRRSPLAREVVASFEGKAQEIWSGTFDLLRKESPEYRNAVDDEFTAESKSHCGELLGAIVAIAAGRLKGSDPFAFVRRHAEWRARHQVPLVASRVPAYVMCDRSSPSRACNSHSSCSCAQSVKMSNSSGGGCPVGVKMSKCVPLAPRRF